jgi:pimeloyl-ACP methyl ester carboxylesterase
MLTPTAEHDGLALYASPGAGESVLWIHGYTLDSTIWSELWAALPGWDHLAVDLAGHGRSRPMRREDTLGTLGATLARLGAAHGVRHVVGLSLGAMVALQVAIESGAIESIASGPRGLASLALAAPALAGGPTDADAATRSLLLSSTYRARGVGPWLRDLWMRWPPDIFRGAARHPTLWDALARVVGRHSWRELEDDQMDRFTRCSQLPRLAEVGCRTLVMVGEDDMAAFKRSAELILRAVPDCERVYLPATGHLGLLESPSASAPLLVAHWRGSSASDATRTRCAERERRHGA